MESQLDESLEQNYTTFEGYVCVGGGTRGGGTRGAIGARGLYSVSMPQ